MGVQVFGRKNGTMKSGILDTCLTLLGMTGLLVYVLACAPSFSPDGRKVAFPVVDYDTDRVSILVCDINKKNFETVTEFANPELPDEEMAYTVQWTPDGKHILITGSSLIMMAPAESRAPARTFQLRGDIDLWSLSTPPVIGDHLFLVTEDEPVLYRLNLQSWEWKSFQLPFNQDESGMVFSDGKQLYLPVKLDKEGQTVYSIMRVNTETGECTRVAQIRSDDTGELTGYSWLKLAGNRFAAVSNDEDTARIVLIRGDSVEKTILAGKEGEDIKIGNLAPSPDGKRIFASVCRKDGSGNIEFGIMESQLDGGETRRMILFTGSPEIDDDKNEFSFQIAISPDGKKIAASSVSGIEYEKLRPGDRALYLVDVSRQEWKSEKIRVPLQPRLN